MRVTIRNRTNKKISVRSKEDLRTFFKHIVRILGIEDWIDEAQLTFTKDHGSYYPKGKPLHGFRRLYDGKIVKIDFAGSWNVSQDKRKRTIIHELTHVKQLIGGKLEISDDSKTAYWKGRKTVKWKQFRFAELDKLREPEDMQAYLNKYLPWEAEVQSNVDEYSFLLD